MRGTVVLLMALVAITSCKTQRADDSARREVLAALAHYDSLIVHMDHDSIAATFMPNGESSDGNQAPIRGPDAIRHSLLNFAAYHVLSNRLGADTTIVIADTAWQTGTYSQRVQIPKGDTVSVSGRFAVTWQRKLPPARDGLTQKSPGNCGPTSADRKTPDCRSRHPYLIVTLTGQ